jgi:hypothetical protein
MARPAFGDLLFGDYTVHEGHGRHDQLRRSDRHLGRWHPGLFNDTSETVKDLVPDISARWSTLNVA